MEVALSISWRRNQMIGILDCVDTTNAETKLFADKACDDWVGAEKYGVSVKFWGGRDCDVPEDLVLV